jgi:hypothetical protein
MARPPWSTKVSDIKKRIGIHIQINKLTSGIFFSPSSFLKMPPRDKMYPPKHFPSIPVKPGMDKVVHDK